MTERMSLTDYNALTKRQRKTRETRSVDKETLGRWLLFSGLPWVTEHRFHPTRKWRADWALVDQKILVEFEGGVFTQDSGHNNFAGYTEDCEKYAVASILGWVVIRCTAPMVRDGKVFELINQAIEARSKLPL